MRACIPLILIAVSAALSACAPPVPDAQTEVVRGPGFETAAQRAARERAREELLRGPMPSPGPTIQPPDQAPGTFITEGNAIEPPLSEAERLALETRGALGLPPAAPGSLPPLDPPSGEDPVGDPLPLPGDAGSSDLGLDRDNPALSREQDFDAVSNQRSIEDDAARVNAAREQRIIVRPEPLERPAELGQNIITYAIEQARPVGTAGAFRRGITASQRAAERRCAGYPSANSAQEEFLSAGGPQRDRLGIDPDGDGNACNWDPAAFRRLLN